MTLFSTVMFFVGIIFASVAPSCNARSFRKVNWFMFVMLVRCVGCCLLLKFTDFAHGK